MATAISEQRAPVLVVDDERQILAAITDTLEDNFHVLTAHSAAEALDIIATEPGLQVMLSDQRMPEMEGVELLARAQSLTNATRVLLTGYADLDAVVRAVNDGKIFAYVSKPWSAEELKHVVYNASEFYRLGRRLREEQGLLHNLMDQTPDGLYFKDLDHRYVRLNPAHARILRAASPQSTLGRTDEEFWPPEVAGAHRRAELQTLRNGRPILDRTDRIDNADGEPRWYSTSKAPISDDTGRYYRIVGITRDITERVEAERQNRLLLLIARAVSAARDFESALREAIVLVCQETGWAYGEARVLNADRTKLVAGTQWYANDIRFAAFHDFGASLEFAKGQGIAGQVWASGAPVWVADILKDNTFKVPIEAAALGLHGALGVPIKDSQGEPIAILLFFLEYPRHLDERLVAVVSAASDQLSNVFERKLAADALARERSFLQALVDSIQDAIVVFDEGGKPIFRNKTAMSLMPAPNESMEGRPWLPGERVASIDGEPFTLDRTPIRRALAGERVDGVQLALEMADRSLRYISVSGAPIPDENGHTRGAVLVLRDVTERHLTEHRLRNAQKMEALGQMIGGISHDFNNIVQVIGGSLDLILAEVKDDTLVKLAGTARAAVDRSADLTKKLLSFSRSQNLEPAEVDLNAHLGGLVDVLRGALGRRVKIETSFGDKVGNVYVDPSELDACVLNLAVNARDAMPDGGTLRVSTYAADAATVRTAGLDGTDYVAAEFSDTGQGIPEAIRDRIFEPYFTTKDEGRGTGLGLSMIYGFVTQSGGQITVRSTEGKGTTFTMLFPRARAQHTTGQRYG
jgi:PAS domain S-box-containing protein